MRYRRRASARKSHGALWSIIYIDLMTQIMAFFVIVWSVEHGTRLTQTPQLGTGVGMGDQTARMVDLPGDVLFASGQTQLAADGRAILDRLFGDPGSGVLSFDQGGLAQRKLVIHGHTDDVGAKDANFALGFQRAYAVYQAIRRHSKEVPDHVVLCSHADNTPARPLPATAAERAGATDARAKNRRITIEDLVVASAPADGADAAPATTKDLVAYIGRLRGEVDAVKRHKRRTTGKSCRVPSISAQSIAALAKGSTPLLACDCIFACEMGDAELSTKPEASVRWVPGSFGVGK